jgi:ribosomal 50S subunit-recycling heat shock protein
VRLDVFLKRVGLIKQRSLAKAICDGGQVSLDGRAAKAGKEVGPGRVIEIDLETERLKIEVLDLPSRNYRLEKGRGFYKVIEHEYKDRYS